MPNTLAGNEIVWVQGIAENGEPSPVLFPVTVSQIAAAGGNGGILKFVAITNTNFVNAQLGYYYGFKAPTQNTGKIIYAPPATGSLGVIKAIDLFGDAGGNGTQGPNNIVFTPNGTDTVVGGSVNNSIYTSFGSQTWRDLEPGVWGAE